MISSWYLCNRLTNKQIMRLLFNENLSIHFSYNVYIMLLNRVLLFIINRFMKTSSLKIICRSYSFKEIQWCQIRTRTYRGSLDRIYKKVRQHFFVYLEVVYNQFLLRIISKLFCGTRTWIINDYRMFDSS